MKYVLIPILIAISATAFAEKFEGVVQCLSYPKIVKTDYYLNDSEIKYPEQIRKIVPQLMRLDLIQRVDAISLVLPKDWRDSEGKPYEVRLQAYNETTFIQQANCLVSHYKEGDRIYYFEQPETGSYDKGYALFRKKKLIAIIVTEGIRV